MLKLLAKRSPAMKKYFCQWYFQSLTCANFFVLKRQYFSNPSINEQATLMSGVLGRANIDFCNAITTYAPRRRTDGSQQISSFLLPWQPTRIGSSPRSASC